MNDVNRTKLRCPDQMTESEVIDEMHTIHPELDVPWTATVEHVGDEPGIDGRQWNVYELTW